MVKTFPGPFGQSVCQVMVGDNPAKDVEGALDAGFGEGCFKVDLRSEGS